MKSAYVVRTTSDRSVALFTNIARAIQYVKVEHDVKLKKNTYRPTGRNASYYVSDYVGVRDKKVEVLCDRMLIQA